MAEEIDGDTLKLATDTGKKKVRLLGVGAPQLGQPYGRESQTFVKNLLDGESI